VRQVLRVIGPGALGDGELCAQDGAGDFGDEFLGDVLLIAKALAEVAVEAVGCAASVGVMPISA
jgi:hypothetical protein